jgi:glucose-6-phosphate dehydrogenase assembly protein OpcA
MHKYIVYSARMSHNSEHKNEHEIGVSLFYMYERESNANLKSVIKIQNTARLSCKLTTVILMVSRVVDRWQYDAGMQHDDAVVV